MRKIKNGLKNHGLFWAFIIYQNKFFKYNLYSINTLTKIVKNLFFTYFNHESNKYF